MKNNSGFIATSLIYTFFLAFIAILTALLGAYIANKTILERYNNDVLDRINTGNHRITIYSSYSNIDGGVMLTNLIKNGTFAYEEGSFKDWPLVGTANFQQADFGQQCLVKNSGTGYLNQAINFKNNDTYYLSAEVYGDGASNLLNIMVSQNNNIALDTSSNLPAWERVSKVFKIQNPDALSYAQIGKTYLSTRPYITKIMILDLSYTYENNIPSKEWVDKNISYFEGTVSYTSKNFIKEDQLEFTITPYAAYPNAKVTCKEASGKDVEYELNKKDTTQTNSPYILTVKELTKDTTCNIKWSQ